MASAQKVFVRAADLIDGKRYPIVDWENVEGPYGAQTKVYLNEGWEFTFLPKRMCKSGGEIVALRCKQLALVRTGMHYVEKHDVYTPLLEIIENWQWAAHSGTRFCIRCKCMFYFCPWSLNIHKMDQ